jgi:hypothetical protein
MALITLDAAKRHLVIDHDELDDTLEEKVDEASGIVLDYLKRPDSEWQTTAGTPDEVPYVVQAATKLVLGALWENREGNDYALLPQPLSPTVKNLLHRLRDPAIA